MLMLQRIAPFHSFSSSSLNSNSQCGHWRYQLQAILDESKCEENNLCSYF